MQADLQYYTGIGSRKTPSGIQKHMTDLADYLECKGYILRSGGADGADMAFQHGVFHPTENMQIFLPWRGFNGHPEGVPFFYPPSPEAFKIAAKYHPKWNQLRQGAQKLHARNAHQVLGIDLETPSKCVICWTSDGKASGGTGQALRIADAYGIPIINMYHDDWLDQFKELKL